MKKPMHLFACASALSILAGAALAKTAPAAPVTTPDSGGVGLSELVVTATLRPERKMDTSVSVSSVGDAVIQQVAPQSSADLIRSIPGIRSEASGGEGNANISVRGLPVASGGAKFVQFQEDGLPVLDFGDIAFGTADTFVKVDYNIDKVELVRGGSASTAASNAPGAVINFITKTGKSDGGAVGLTEGLDFNRTRLDLDYGGHIGDQWRFHVGGFYNYGTGPKSVGYSAENGGQIKANITREFEHGFIRLDAKFLDDRAPVWLPVPVGISTVGGGTKFTSLPGFDFLNGALQTPYLQNLLSLDHNGNRVTDHLSDGYHTVTKAFGGEVSFDVGSGIQLDDKFRMAFNSGGFVGPYPGNVDTSANIASSIGGAGSSLVVATGPNAGSAYAGPYAVNTVIFDTTLRNFNVFSNQLTLSKTFDAGEYGHGSLTFSYFHSNQTIGMDWHWTDYVLGAQGQNAPLLNVVNAAGKTVTDHGLVGYNAAAFGNCCVRNYDVDYSIDAPSLNADWKFHGLDVDASVRYDIQGAHGTYAESTGPGTAIDVNQDGVISAPEQSVKVVNNLAASPVNYTKHYWSYSVGANYEFTPDLAIFGRISRGARFNADRVLPGDANGMVPNFAAINYANQQEVGAKFQTRYLSGAITGFHSSTAEQGSDITPAGLLIISRDYRAYGVEVEANAHYGIFNLYGGLTYTDAKITADALTPSDVGNTPQRQAQWVYQVRPTVTWKAIAAGLNIIGASDAPADNTDTLIQPGYVVVGGFASYNVTERLQVQIHADNIFNSVGVTEVDQFPNAHGVGSARSILGRRVSAGVRFTF